MVCDYVVIKLENNICGGRGEIKDMTLRWCGWFLMHTQKILKRGITNSNKEKSSIIEGEALPFKITAGKNIVLM